MKQRKVISLPTNQSKIYRQILAFMNFMLNITPQERDVLAEIIRLNNEYSALPLEKRAKFILSKDMRKEIRELVKIEEKQFNVIISRLKKKLLFNKPLLDDNNFLHPELCYLPDSDGFKIEVNLVMTSTKPNIINTIPEEPEEPLESLETTIIPQPPVEYKHDASKAPVIIQEEFDIEINLPDE
jgi:hypothetical protein